MTPFLRSHSRTRPAVRGFTLIELLTVIAIIGVLAAILIPTTAKVRESSKKAKTRAQFSQWIQAIEGFRQEYGYYPNFDRTAATPTPAINLYENADSIFYEVLSGYDRAATPAKLSSSTLAPATDALRQNKKSIQFYTFASDEIVLTAAGAVSAIQDAFEGQEIVVVLDTDLNGILPKASFLDLDLDPSKPDLDSDDIVENGDSTVTNVRAGVAIYSRGKGEELGQVVTSWR